MNIIGKKNIFLGIAIALVLASFYALGTYGLKEGIDFSGGTLWRIKIDISEEKLKEILVNDLKVEDPKISQDTINGNYLIRMADTNQDTHSKLLETFKGASENFEELSFQSIGPSVGEELKQRSIMALILVLVGISLYIAYAFRKVYRPVSSWKYGIVTLVTLFHDVLIPAGLLAILGHYSRVEIDGNFVVALLVIMGFSVHDTIVVFDRIRENLFLDRGKTDFGKVINDSVNQTMARSINTSLTLILVLLALYFAGPEALRYFNLTLLVGVVTGIYSSIFVASPLLHTWHMVSKKEA